MLVRIIKNKKGETIAETLMATLIAALAMVMFAGMVIASKNIIEESNQKIKDYYDGFSQLISKTEVTTQSMGPITIYINKNGVIYYDYDGSGGSGEEP